PQAVPVRVRAVDRAPDAEACEVVLGRREERGAAGGGERGGRAAPAPAAHAAVGAGHRLVPFANVAALVVGAVGTDARDAGAGDRRHVAGLGVPDRAVVVVGDVRAGVADVAGRPGRRHGGRRVA